MKPGRILIATVALATVLLLGASCISGVYAADQPVSGTCWNGTLNGSYGFYATGNLDGPYAAIGTLTFDGKGNCKREQAVSFNGTFERNELSFKYTVAADCTGKALYKGVEFQAFVIVNGGNELYILKESAQTVYLAGKKIHP